MPLTRKLACWIALGIVLGAFLLAIMTFLGSDQPDALLPSIALVTCLVVGSIAAIILGISLFGHDIVPFEAPPPLKVTLTVEQRRDNETRTTKLEGYEWQVHDYNQRNRLTGTPDDGPARQ